MLSAAQTSGAVGDMEVAGPTLMCPRCGGSLAAESSPGLRCRACRFLLGVRDGIWLALPPERQAYFSQFISDYERVRKAEGRGSGLPTYYLALPFKDLSGRHQSQWAIRARTYRYLVSKILPRVRQVAGTRARVLDMGAGSGWLSYRLALMGLRPVAVDLLVNDEDGLGAAKHYSHHLPAMFPRVQADSAHLPFADSQFDAVIFNASFHYAENYSLTLIEAMRCLKTGGTVVVADSPWYAKEASGDLMLQERRAAFLSSFGTASDSLHSQEFLTDARLQDLEKTLGLRWARHVPFYGLRWSMRPWIARMKGCRPPARFRIYTARKTA
jgi:SAM-dependent methyltransferase